VLVAFGEVAAGYGYCRATVGDESIDIEAGRHPVVERTEEAFVPNDTHLSSGPVRDDDTEPHFVVLTGPNMSGKSTYMRQVALCCILAQAGSFVPAESADLPVLDRVFTRVGASDDIAGGRSTFMIEMTELATILTEATGESLVLLDEVGRGTSTADGLAIARAVTEFLHDEVGAYTLFATHHHDLTAAAAEFPGVANRHFETSREDGEVVFDHELASGPASASYGVEVADMAGVPGAVVARARDHLGGDEPGDTSALSADPATNGDTAGGRATNGHADPDAIERRLREVDVATMTPLEALNTLADLADVADERHDTNG